MTKRRTVTRTVKYIPYGEFYPRDLEVSLPRIEFIEGQPLWESDWWKEAGQKSAVAQMKEKTSPKNNKHDTRTR